MGSQCSALRKGKIKEDEATTKGESREKSPLMQRKPSLKEEEGAMKETTEEETLRSQVEESSSKETACIEYSSSLAHGYTDVDVHTSSPSLSETHDTASAMRENKAEDFVKEVIKIHKAHLREQFKYEFEGPDTDRGEAQSLDNIYTELHIVQEDRQQEGVQRVNIEHEIWEIEDKARSQKAEECTKLHCNNIFKSTLKDSVSSQQEDLKAIRTVVTKGIAGIGKTVSVKKFILDWADGNANQDLDFIFVLPFRKLNLVKNQHSLETLVREFHPELKKISVARVFADHNVLFIFDGLDESQLQLNFRKTELLTDVTKESSVDTLVTNLIREDLLPSAHVWITSRPGAVQRIPRRHVYRWTEVRGFNDPQKIEYFQRRVEDKSIAARIIDSIMMSRSLYIMCHIPIFCWIAAKVLAVLLLRMDNTQDKDIKIPTTLTEMYTHFLCIQMQVATEKYDEENGLDQEEIFESNDEFIFKLGRMAFEYLIESTIVFTDKDLEKYGIDIRKAGVDCGLCTVVFKQEEGLYRKKLYCFVHLTVQEYFAALFVYRSFASKKIDSPSLMNFLLKGSEKELKCILDADPVDLPLDELIEIAIANSLRRKTGELDMFLRFLIGMSLRSTQELLQGLIQQKEEHSRVVEEIRTSLVGIDIMSCPPERCLNLVHCLIELKDSSIHDTVQKYLKPDHDAETQLSPFQCSALANSIIMSKEPLEEFNLKKYRPSANGIFRLVPAVRNCKKARISGVNLDVYLCETISSALRKPNSVLTELHLINISLSDKGARILGNGLENSQCNLEALSFSTKDSLQEEMASAIKSVIKKETLRELELSGKIMVDTLYPLLSDGLFSPKLEKLRLNRNQGIAKIFKEFVAALASKPCSLQELELSYTSLKDSEMEILSTGLMSTNCNLEVLNLSHNRLTEKGCKMLASALSSKSSRLTKLDLSYNDLRDSGVMALCTALTKPQCGLKTLRLSFCKVTVDGCVAMASALRSEHCGLRELDLKFNHLADKGVTLLTDIQRDACCSLEKLNVDQNEECWFDLKLLRQYASDLTLDPNTACVNAILTENNKRADYVEEKQPYPDHPDRFKICQVLCEEGLTGRHYWEVECPMADVGVAYKSIDRMGDCARESIFGENEKSWCLTFDGFFKHNCSEGFIVHDEFNSSQSTVGVYLDWPAGILSFFEVLPDTLTHLYTVSTTFNKPLHPGFFILPYGSIYFHKLN
ncbi:protein NLRC3-like isoform X2 [Trematomus bernacchii]|uniref:protein NLRC3-like isoform X2 n=1 Tax=Trematomus bernacchii TaxID=40690 RepID=UPI00146D916E|nr:protein NLRC3-like isoform X2 [Trematomus bernacchii]